jgi:hypothetical protein
MHSIVIRRSIRYKTIFLFLAHKTKWDFKRHVREIKVENFQQQISSGTTCNDVLLPLYYRFEDITQDMEEKQKRNIRWNKINCHDRPWDDLLSRNSFKKTSVIKILKDGCFVFSFRKKELRWIKYETKIQGGFYSVKIFYCWKEIPHKISLTKTKIKKLIINNNYQSNLPFAKKPFYICVFKLCPLFLKQQA